MITAWDMQILWLRCMVRMDIAKRQLIAELLDETAPWSFVASTQSHPVQIQLSPFYDRPEMQVAPKEPQQTEGWLP